MTGRVRRTRPGDADRPLLWAGLPEPVKALKGHAKWCWLYGSFPKPRHSQPGGSVWWPASEVAAWAAEPENAAWLRRENERIARIINRWEGKR